MATLTYAALMLPVIRRAHTSSHPRLTRFALHKPNAVEVEFSDGRAFNLPAEYLRVYSPAVDSKIRTIGGEKQSQYPAVLISDLTRPVEREPANLIRSLNYVISGRRHVGIMSAEPIGNYGVRINFDDLHKTGIYIWDYFYHLAVNKFPLMRNYIKSLKKHGLSRDPNRRK